MYLFPYNVLSPAWIIGATLEASPSTEFVHVHVCPRRAYRTENDGVPSGKSSKPLSRRDFKKFGNVEDRKPIADAWSQRVNEEGDSAADPHHVQAHDHDQAHTRFDLVHIHPHMCM